MQGRDMKINRKHIYYTLTGLLIFAFLATRLWRISTIPSGLNVDEAAMAYSAWCFSQEGVDRYLRSWPIYFLNFDGGQSIMYGYLCAGLFKLFGYHVILIRVPAVFFSLLTLVFGMLLIKKIFPQSPLVALAAGGLITICPYFIMASRFGLDCNTMLGMSTVFLYCFICAIESGKYKWYLGASIAGGLVLYTYAVSYLVLPIFLILSLIYTIWVKRFEFLKWVCMAIPMGFLAFPLILEQFVNMFDLEEVQLGVFTITKMEAYRIYELRGIQWKYFLQAFKSIFIGDPLTYNSIPGFPNLYYLTIPLAALGFIYIANEFVKSWKNRELSRQIYLLFWFLVVLLVVSCTDNTTNKINGIFFVIIFFVVQGIMSLLNIGRKYTKIILVLCSVMYCIGFVRFSTYYYLGNYTADYHPLSYFDITVEDAVNFLDENPQYLNQGTYLAESPVYLALSMRLSPYDMDMEAFEKSNVFSEYWYCNQLPGIEEGYNYIVRDIYVDYANTLRSLGYGENAYIGYSLFYWIGE